MSIVNRIKVNPVTVNWGEWALPLEVYTCRRGFAVRLLVFEVIFWIECDHKWKVYHRHGKAYRRCLRPNCEVWETVAAPVVYTAKNSTPKQVGESATVHVMDEWQQKES